MWGVEIIDPLHFLAGCRKRRLNQALSLLSLSLGFLNSVAPQYVHCYKGDAASQWEMAILGVSELHNP